MGSMLQARCTGCGLEQGLGVGGGMMSFMTVAAVPAGCARCHNLVTVNAKLAPPYECPTEGCAGSPVIIGELVGLMHRGTDPTVFDWLVDDDAGLRYELRDRAYRCPACGASSLTFESAGFFD